MTPLEREAAQRAEFIASLREIADLLEADASLPIPHTSRLHAGMGVRVFEEGGLRTTTEAERFAAVRRAAGTLGVDVVEEANRARKATRMFGRIEYFVYAPADERAADRLPRVVSEYEDRALIGGAL